MTICIAAIAGGNAIIGASDRMITSGMQDIQYEPKATGPNKQFVFTRSIYAMLAGDTAIQTEVLRAVGLVIQRRVTAEPANWWLLSDVAQLYRTCYADAIRLRAEAAVLLPIGLDLQRLHDGNHEFSDEQVAVLLDAMGTHRPRDVGSSAAIICGRDPSGVHVYKAENGFVWCEDLVGFSTIGIGEHHVISELTNAGYSPQMPEPEVLSYVFNAKKRAEAAPGVGQATDMFYIGTALGQSFALPDALLQQLGTLHTKARAAETAAREEGVKAIDVYVNEEAKKNEGQGPQTPSAGPSTPPPAPPPGPTPEPPSTSTDGS